MTPTTVRIATLNLMVFPTGRWDERRPLVEATLQSLRPDIVALQEVDRTIDQDHGLAASAVPPYRAFRGSSTIRSTYPRHWNAVSFLVAGRADRVTHHDTLSLSYHRLAQRLRLVTDSGARLDVVNTHLHHPVSEKGRTARYRQAQALLSWFAEGDESTPIVLCGDLNGTPDEPFYTLLKAEGFESAFYAVHGHEPEKTYPSGLFTPGWTPPPDGEPPVCVDYILYRGDVRPLSASLAWNLPSGTDATLYPSDHIGLVADLSFP